MKFASLDAGQYEPDRRRRQGGGPRTWPRAEAEIAEGRSRRFQGPAPARPGAEKFRKARRGFRGSNSYCSQEVGWHSYCSPTGPPGCFNVLFASLVLRCMFQCNASRKTRPLSKIVRATYFFSIACTQLKFETDAMSEGRNLSLKQPQCRRDAT